MELSYVRVGLSCIPFVGDLVSLAYYSKEDLIQATNHRNALIQTRGQETEAFQTFYETRRIYGLCNCTRYILQMAWCVHCLVSNLFISSILGFYLIIAQGLYAFHNGIVAIESKDFFKSRVMELDNSPYTLKQYINPTFLG